MPVDVPRLTTARLILRSFEERDRASLSFARETLRRDEIISIIRPANVRSIRVAESLGAMHERDVEFFGDLSRIYRYPKR
jgi:hypothetical protein